MVCRTSFHLHSIFYYFLSPWEGGGLHAALRRRRWQNYYCGDGAAVEQRRRRARSMKIGKPERVPRAERERTDRLLLGQNQVILPSRRTSRKTKEDYCQPGTKYRCCYIRIFRYPDTWLSNQDCMNDCYWGRIRSDPSKQTNEQENQGGLL